jgi:hypothetical protein
VRNFLAGLLLGVLVAYWYLTDGASVRTTVSDLWERASAPPRPPAVRRVP